MPVINTNNNANVAYNYQKVPNLVKSDSIQSSMGLVVALRDKANYNRNVLFAFPANYSTPNFNINSPTIGAVNNTEVGTTYTGKQI